VQTRFITLAGVTLVAGLATSCGLLSLDVSSRRDLSAHKLSSLEPQAVAFLAQPPKTQYTVVGTIRVGWFGIRTDKAIANDVGIQNALRQEAGRLGADAVTDIVLVRRRDHWPGDTTEPYAGHLEATAIRTGMQPHQPHAMVSLGTLGERALAGDARLRTATTLFSRGPFSNSSH
jgi:hypothetical protein